MTCVQMLLVNYKEYHKGWDVWTVSMPIRVGKNETCGDVLGLKREAPRVLEPIKAKQSDDTTEIRYRLQQQESGTT